MTVHLVRGLLRLSPVNKPLRHKLDKGPDLGREVAIGEVDDGDRASVAGMVAQDFDEPAVIDVAREHVVLKMDKPAPGDRRRDHALGMVEAQAGVGLMLNRPSIDREGPRKDPARARKDEPEPFMATQVVQVRGPAASRDVVRRSAGHEAGIEELAGDQRRVVERARADGDVDSVLDQIGEAVRSIEFNLDVRVHDGKGWQQRRQHEGREGDTGGNLESAARRLATVEQEGFGAGDLAERAAAAVVKRSTVFGHLQRPRAAAQELKPQGLLKPRHRFTNGRGGDAELACCGDEGTRRNGADEHGDAVEMLHCAMIDDILSGQKHLASG
jgi:hypothetical protein